MQRQLQENQPPVNFYIGPTKNAKTSLCHFLTGSELTITKIGNQFITIAQGCREVEKMIGNDGPSMTKNANYFGDYNCDFPGLNDTDGDEKRLKNLLVTYNELQNTQNFRLILIVEESTVTTSMCSVFYNFTNEIIGLFGLTPNCVRGIHLVVTKSSQEFIEDLPETIKYYYKNEANFIFEGIKNGELKISSFDKPKKNGENFVFSKVNKQQIKNNLESTGYLNNNEIKNNFLPKIFEYIDKVKNSGSYDKISFISEIIDNPTVQFKKILVIDQDIDLTRESLEIKSKIIIVKALDRKLSLTIRSSNNPTIIFSPDIKMVINGSSLILTTANTENKRDFLNPKDDDFNKSSNLIRLESFCINSFLTEYLSYNNKFIELIVYFNKDFGTIAVDDKWNIKKITCDIDMKLYINERMGTKDGIVNDFKSLRNFEDAASYLKEAKGVENNQSLVDFLENYIVNLPTIFEIFMKPSYFRKIDQTEINDLRKIRRILIKRYLEFIKALKSQESISNLEKFNEDYEHLRSFVSRITNGNEETFTINENLIEGIDNLMENVESDIEIENFLSLFYNLSLTEHKILLCNHFISGDKSNYPNFQALLRIIDQVPLSNEIINLLSESTPISVIKLLALLAYNLKNHHAIIMGLGILIRCIKILLNAVKLAELPLFLSGLILELGLNHLIGYLKCGYYKNSIKVKGKDIRLDCVVNPRLLI